MKQTQKGLIVIATVLILIVVWTYGEKEVTTAELPVAETQEQKVVAQTPNLKDAVITAIDNELKIRYADTSDVSYLTWDKRVDITSMDNSQKAAKGKWWQKDAWDWIAWQQDGKDWKVLVSFDGFSCEELDAVPTDYDVFFEDVIYQFGNRYCY